MEEKSLALVLGLFAVKEVYEIFKLARNKHAKDLARVLQELHGLSVEIGALKRELETYRSILISAFRPFAEKREPEDSPRAT